MTTRTFDVEHQGSHYPTDAQQRDALRAVLKSEGLKLSGEAEFFLVENTSGGPSKVRATFETETSTLAKTVEGKMTSGASKPVAEPKTKTVGG